MSVSMPQDHAALPALPALPALVARGAARRLLARRRLPRLPSALDELLAHVAGSDAVEHGRLRPWLDLVVHAYIACDGHARAPGAERTLSVTTAAVAATVTALDILDDLADGDEPDAGRQAPNLALALVGEATSLLSLLPATSAAPLLALWGSMWTRCAAAQARDVSLSADAHPSVEQALAVAEGSGLVTRWAVEAGALAAGAPAAMAAPLARFGHDLGTAEKLLHDVHDLWPGPSHSRDLRRPCCSLALALARREGTFPALEDLNRYDDDTLRRRLLDGGALHQAWAYADLYRLRAAGALERFAATGGAPNPLNHILALPADLALSHAHAGR